jgi:6-phosphogluconolactonase
MKRGILSVVLTLAMLLGLGIGFSTSVSAGENYSPGAVYVMTNVASNAVVAYTRGADGSLSLVQTVMTGGDGFGGDGDPLGSQGSLILTNNGKWLLACNAGSNEISVLRAGPGGLSLVDKVPSGGTMPVSLTVSDDVVYVLNAGGTPNITGFTLSNKGELTPIAGSTRTLTAPAYHQVGFDKTGKWLIVTEEPATIEVFSVDDGIPALASVTSPSHGVVPFGFIFDSADHLLVVEVVGDGIIDGLPGAPPKTDGAVSSYRIMPNGKLQVISPSKENDQTAACWIVGNDRGDVFTTNPGSPSISAYEDENGTVSLEKKTAATQANLDAGISDNGRFLYGEHYGISPALSGITTYRIEANDSLTYLGLTKLATIGQGIAVR